jgi:hypothetical protein
MSRQILRQSFLILIKKALSFTVTIILTFFIIQVNLHSSTKVNVDGEKILSLSFKKACDLYHYPSELVLQKDLAHIECLNKILETHDACKKAFEVKMATNKFLRGVIQKRNILCHFGNRVSVKIDCEKSPFWCTSKKEGCKRLKSIYAFDLGLVHAGKVSKEGKDYLTCYYE